MTSQDEQQVVREMPEGRVFLVGCPRSGTTALQLQLAKHPDVVTFPESHFFDNMLVNRSRLRKVLRMAAPKTGERLEVFAENLKLAVRPLPTWGWPYNEHYFTKKFVAVLDERARAAQARVWLEKTPGHSRCIDYIEAQVPACKFLHIVRDGCDVIASLYRVTRDYPEHWSGPWSLQKCINRWVSSIDDSIRHCQKTDKHMVLFYDDLMSHGASCLNASWRFINVTPLSLEQGLTTHGSLQGAAAPFEHWKADSVKNLQDYRPKKAEGTMLCEEDKRRITEAVDSVDLSPLREASRAKMLTLHAGNERANLDS